MAESVTFEDKKLFGTVKAVFNTHVRALVLLDGGLWDYDVYMYSCGDICPGEFASDAASPMRDGDADYCTRTSAKLRESSSCTGTADEKRRRMARRVKGGGIIQC